MFNNGWSPFDSRFGPELLIESFEIAKIRNIAGQVPPMQGMKCGIWAQQFQERLLEQFIDFTPACLRLGKGDRGHGCAIYYNQLQIGHDNHLYTVVNGVVYDNVNPGGIMLQNFRDAIYCRNPSGVVCNPEKYRILARFINDSGFGNLKNGKARTTQILAKNKQLANMGS